MGATLDRATAALRGAGIDSPAREARLLLAHVLGESPGALMLAPRDTMVSVSRFDALLARRLRHEPMAHLLGSRGFWSLDLAVSPATLVPRADSETVIETLLALRPERGAVRRVLDLGTGTGCLLLAALAEYPSAWGLGVERAPQAAALARANARRNGLAGRSAVLCSDWGAALGERGRGGGFDVILANPPYIPSGDLSGLMAEVRHWEPRAALDGGADGLDAYRTILPLAMRLLAEEGVLLLEFGIGQAPALVAMLAAHGFDLLALRCDLGGIERVMAARRRLV
ncbi:release factor glutamine methyltransferase [Endobacter medicaginis]|uniref:Release factor glutamine methyltransferase n=3 Tax=Endobacter medicaginis TaxID=1181271 RepID=A0A839UZW8_9PROT|nr:peptide chain release factor N(5)-glutamine methyltransferase [Endobacter medicaginis]MBB3172932.1 release factor glutamine methyltransferase [Endobacter medicaginis]MCX5474856.1 peptide chain release factor N(5)-glutamine methyltransferase [Endobacter medicaginis]